MDQTNYRTVIHVDKTYLKFLLVKRFEEMLRNKFIKTFLQSQELCLNSSHEPPVHIQPVGEEGKVRGDELVSTGISTAGLENAHFSEDLVLMHTFCIMKEVLIHSFFHQQLIIGSSEKPKYHSELHLPRCFSENIHVIYDSGFSTQNTHFLSFTVYKNSVYYPLPTTFAGHISVCNTWHTPSCSLLSLEYSCHLVWVHAVKSSRRHCVPHRTYGPGLVWYRSLCQWTEGKLSIFDILVTLSGDADSYLNT